MAKFYEVGIPKWQRIVGYMLSILFSFQIFMAGLMKIIANPEMIKVMASLGAMANYTLFVGWGELILLALYWIPQTRKLGFFLMCSFVGGIIATEIIAERPVIVGIITAVLLYAGTIMRYPSLLKSMKGKENSE